MTDKTKKMRALIAVGAVTGLLLGAVASNASAARPEPAALEGVGEGLKLVANVPWKQGTDMEVRKIKGREYVFATSRGAVADGGGLQIVDVTKPEKPKLAARVPCVVSQGDIQISHDNKTVMMAHDSTGGPEACLGMGKTGFLLIDIKNPRKPKVVGHADTNLSHNITAHPTKPYVYNSTSALAPPGNIQIWSIKNPKKPELVNTVPSLPHAPHDVGFNKKGDRAVTAAISHFDIFDTSDPENPTLLFTGQCPYCSITHDAKYTPDGTHLLIGDEAGGGLTFPCPGGALHSYLMQGDTPVYVGSYVPRNFVVNAENTAGSCTSHVFEITNNSKRVAISWYTLGTRHLDISEPHGLAVGDAGAGFAELGWFVPEGGNSWSSKFSINEKYIFSNDQGRGLDIYKIVKK